MLTTAAAGSLSENRAAALTTLTGVGGLVSESAANGPPDGIPLPASAWRIALPEVLSTRRQLVAGQRRHDDLDLHVAVVAERACHDRIPVGGRGP